MALTLVYLSVFLCSFGYVLFSADAAEVSKEMFPAKIRALQESVADNPIEKATATTHPEWPMVLHIPTLGVAAPIEPVGVTADGAMGTPTDFMAVAWYSPGVLPGDVGRAVFAGHLDDAQGTDAIFAKLNRLTLGDGVVVNNGNGETQDFVVYDIARYPYDAVPTRYIFGDSTHAEIVLITCAGVWLSEEKTYSERLVVYARSGTSLALHH